jgi:hypothetical protein
VARRRDNAAKELAKPGRVRSGTIKKSNIGPGQAARRAKCRRGFHCSFGGLSNPRRGVAIDMRDATECVRRHARVIARKNQLIS